MFVDREAPFQAYAEEFASRLGVGPRRGAAARQTYLRQQLAGSIVERVWELRRSPHETLFRRLLVAAVPKRLALYALLYAAQYSLWLVAWAVIGSVSLESRAEMGLLTSWVLLVATCLCLQLTCSWIHSTIGLRVGAVIKESILVAGLKSDIDQMKKEGPSHLLARSVEAQAIEQALVTGGLYAVIGTIELLFAAAVLAMGSCGFWHVALLILWVSMFAGMWSLYFRRREEWTNSRVEMSHGLFEKMVGFRTRIAQLPMTRWHSGEDPELRAYYTLSRRMDSIGAVLTPVIWHGWIAIGVLGIIMASLGARLDSLRVAVSVGGVLLAGGALRRLTQSLLVSTDALGAWRHVKTLFEVLPRPANHGVALGTQAGESDVILSVRELMYGHTTRSKPIIDGWSLEIRERDRILLEGPSGSGKSTLAALMSSLRQPQGGTILLRGLDRATIGDSDWRRRVITVPQFHENHLFADTLAFNILMGRRWPATAADLVEAKLLCDELGLAPLLARMPAGMLQIVGDNGWQLSHGERSRVYIARALIQAPQLLILDESFSALDPENFELSMKAVLRRAGAVMVIAHP